MVRAAVVAKVLREEEAAAVRESDRSKGVVVRRKEDM
jgi:hypothetical protein